MALGFLTAGHTQNSRNTQPNKSVTGKIQTVDPPTPLYPRGADVRCVGTDCLYWRTDRRGYWKRSRENWEIKLHTYMCTTCLVLAKLIPRALYRVWEGELGEIPPSLSDRPGTSHNTQNFFFRIKKFPVILKSSRSAWPADLHFPGICISKSVKYRQLPVNAMPESVL